MKLIFAVVFLGMLQSCLAAERYSIQALSKKIPNLLSLYLYLVSKYKWGKKLLNKYYKDLWILIEIIIETIFQLNFFKDLDGVLQFLDKNYVHPK